MLTMALKAAETGFRFSTEQPRVKPQIFVKIQHIVAHLLLLYQ